MTTVSSPPGAAAPVATTRSGAPVVRLAGGGQRGAAEVAGRRVAVVGVLGHRALDDGLEARRHGRRALADRRRVVVQVRPQRRLVGLALVAAARR